MKKEGTENEFLRALMDIFAKSFIGCDKIFDHESVNVWNAHGEFPR